MNPPPITAFTALTDIAEDEQCAELEQYLTEKGAKFNPDPPEELSDRFQPILRQCDVVFQDKDIPQQEVDSFFYTVVSLFHVVSPEDTRQYMTLFLDKMSAGVTKDTAATVIKLLGLTFGHFEPTNPLCPLILLKRLQVAKQMGMVSSLPLDLDKLQQWVTGWNLSDQDKKDLYLQFWNAYQDSPNKSLNSGLLIQLLKCYSSAEAHQVSELARQLVVLSIADPQLFLLDHLLTLEPVAALRGEKIYELLTIFVQEKFSTFVQFYNSNKEIVDSLGLDHCLCLRKMRLLTIASLAVEASEVSFSDLMSELDLPQEEVELMVIEAIQLKLISARINQVTQSLVVMSSVHRTFGEAQWRLLHNRLSSLKHSIHTVKSSLENLKT